MLRSIHQFRMQGGQTPPPMGPDDSRSEVRSRKPGISRRVATSDDVEVSTYLEIAKEKRGQQPLSEEADETQGEAIVIVDFGSQYSRLIVRRVRECKVYCTLVPHTATWEDVASLNPKGVILSGGPASVL